MSRETRFWFWSALLAISGGFLYLLAPVLTPFVFSALLAYLGDPLVDRIDRWQPKLSRTWAVVTVFVVLFLLLLLLLLFLLPLLGRQFAALVQRLPFFLEFLQTTILPWLQNQLGADSTLLDLSSVKKELLNYIAEVSNIATFLLSSITHSSVVVIGWLANVLLIPVVTFYLLRDWDILMARIRDLLPRRIEPVIIDLAKESDEVLGAFLRGQLVVMMALGVIYSLGLFIAGLDFSLLIGMLAGLVSFVPYLGFIVGIVVAGIAAVIQFHDFWHLLPVLLVFSVGQAIEGMLLTPLLVGDRIGLHPVAVIFAVLVGGHLFGFFGVLLALPVAAIIMVLLRHTHDEYLKSVLYHD
ncbi:MAG: AI-2E family transporter [Gammaproteobacteria bacterium]|nr:AI-2E family transporter [Gammaproteobacteria bacterium]MCP5424671.1 AI-2E family transporter [Gammaproteobacteria bacterium]